MKKKRSISRKITVMLFGIMLVTMGLNMALDFFSLRTMNRTWKQSSGVLGRTAANNAESALEDSAKQQLLAISGEKAAYIEEKFLTVEAYAHGIANLAKKIYTNPGAYPEREVFLPRAGSRELAAQLLRSEELAGVDAAEDMELKKLGNIQDLLVEYNAGSSMVNSTYLATENGWMIQADCVAYSKYSMKRTEPDYFEAKSREWYQKAKRTEEGKVVYSDIMKDAYGGGDCIVCSEPVYVNGKIAAVAGVGSYLGTVSRVVSETTMSGKGYAVLVNQEGAVIASPLKQGEMALPDDGAVNLLKSKNQELARIAGEMIRGKSGVEETRLDDEEVYIAYAPLKTLGWSFATVVTVDEILAPAKESERQILELSDEAEKRRDVTMRGIILTFMIIAAGMLLVCSLMCMLVTDRIAGPIKRLTKEVKKTGNGDWNHRIRIASGDEIEDLGNAFNDMAKQIQTDMDNLSRVTAEKERIRTELKVAAKLQSDMLPVVDEITENHPEFTLAASMTPAKEVGGDFYDFFWVDRTHLAIVVADVSGKGVPAALFMTIAKTLLQYYMIKEESLAEAIRQTNESLCRNNKNDMFVTVWAGILSTDDGTLIYVNAGHCRPLVERGNGEFIWLTDRGGFVLAARKGMKYRQSAVTLASGDTLFLYSDGVTEAGDEAGNLYGEEQLKILLDHVSTTEPRKILAAVWQDIERFQGGAEQFDDITMLSLRYNGGKKRKYILEGPADCSRMPEISEFVEDSLQKENISEKNRISILIAAEEIFTNISKYSGAESARIMIEMTEDNAVLVLEDDGIAFNPLKAKEPDITLRVDRRPVGGLGIYMVKKLMDRAVYEYSDGKNRLTMYKSLNFPEAFHTA